MAEHTGATAGPDAEADPLWDDWETSPRVSGIPELHLQGFDGPMDLLLDLAERQRIDLGRISILQLTDQFLAGMARRERHVALERRADWLVIATRLALLCSRLLFPKSPQVEAEAAREEGREVERLETLASVRAAAAWLAARPQLGQEVFARPQGRSPRVVSYMALMEACLGVLRGREGRPGAEEPVYRPASLGLFRVDEAMMRIRMLVESQPEEVAFARCLPAVSSDDPLYVLKARSAVASSLVAVLELARGGALVANQEGPETPILLSASRR